MLEQLNPSQREAVEYIGGPSLVIAGAGSGKTRVLTYKIAYLLQHGVKPWNILALTFTNKAANEMKDRIGQLVGNDTARFLQMGTFHSIFSRILRAEADNIPTPNTQHLTPSYTIYDEADSRSLLKNIIKEMNLDDKIYKPATVHGRISMAKNNIELPSDYARNDHHRLRDRDSRMEQIPNIYSNYQQRLQQSNAMDFDDLLLYTYILFRDRDDIRQKYAARFQYVLVDEYQDTNAVQQMIVLQIVREHHRVCVVGDDAQSIYGFRGANIDNILDFQQQFTSPQEGQEGVRLFKLEQNYRSTQNIVNAANSLIDHNKRQIHKQVYSENAQGERLQLKFCYSDREEAIIVCRDIRRLMRAEGMKYNSFAILYRTNAQSRTFEEQMRKDGIPYRIFGGLSFYQRKEIKDVIAYLRLVVNQHDEEALRRIINYPARGIGNTTVEKIMRHAQQLGVAPWEVIANPEATALPVNKGTMTKLHDFASLIEGFAATAGPGEGGESAFDLGRRIIQETGITKDIYSGTDPDDISRQENLQELIDSMREFVDTKSEESGEEHIFLTDFLQEVSLMSDLDSDDNAVERVVLMTIHSAKGLEFPTVFIVGMEENIFPSPMAADSARALEEERRLLYVAITRAEKHCILTSAQSRYRYGRMEFDTPSRFLNDINPAYLEVQNMQQKDDDDLPWQKPRRSTFRDEQPAWQRTSRTTPSRPTPSSHPTPSSSHPTPSPFRTEPPKPAQPQQTFSGRRMVRVPSTPSSHPLQPSRQLTTPPLGGGREGLLTPGTRIEHERFGIGTVLKVEGTGESTKATVEFQNAGTKQLLLKFARFKTL